MNITSTKDLGRAIRTIRNALGVTQDQLALTSGTNRRFVIELEAGKATIQAGKVLQILRTLGIGVTLAPPSGIDVANFSAGAEKIDDGPAA